MTDNISPREADLRGFTLDRRKFLQFSGAGLLVTAVPGLLASCSSGGSGAARASASSGGAVSKDPLVAQVFATGLDPANKVLPAFTQQYGRQASAQTIPSDYYTVSETRLLGGKPPFDTFDFDPGFLQKFTENGWIVELDGLPNVDELKSDMYPAALASLTSSDGKLMGLPQYTNVVSMFYNEEILSDNGLKPAKDWAEIVDQGKFLKTKGIPTPVIPVWTTKFNLTNGMFIAECISRGMNAQFDRKLDPQWDKNPIARDVLDFWRELQDAALVPVDALTIDHHQSSSVMQAGQGAYFWFNSYEQMNLNKVGTSNVAGKIRVAMMPGRTHGTSTFTAPTFQSTRHDPKDAWPLTSFLAGKDKNGKYTGPVQRCAIANGTLLGYKSTADDPAITAAWKGWRSDADIKVLSDQLSLAKGEGAVLNQSWYATYNDYMTKTLSSFLAKQVSADEALKSSADYVRTLK
jgi:multiple sugar transport system substrate-binding protein